MSIFCYKTDTRIVTGWYVHNIYKNVQTVATIRIWVVGEMIAMSRTLNGAKCGDWTSVSKIILNDTLCSLCVAETFLCTIFILFENWSKCSDNSYRTSVKNLQCEKSAVCGLIYINIDT